jgi:hypothetical protein
MDTGVRHHLALLLDMMVYYSSNGIIIICPDLETDGFRVTSLQK